MIWSALALRTAIGLRSRNMLPVFPVEPCIAPTKETMWLTAWSFRTTALRAAWRSFIAGKEMSCGASEKPDTEPVSCWGKRPKGIDLNR